MEAKLREEEAKKKKEEMEAVRIATAKMEALAKAERHRAREMAREKRELKHQEILLMQKIKDEEIKAR